jgi:hypothetical protein
LRRCLSHKSCRSIVSWAMVSATCIFDRSRWKKVWPAGRSAHLLYRASAGLMVSFASAADSSLGTGGGATAEAMVCVMTEGVLPVDHEAVSRCSGESQDSRRLGE